MNIFNLDLVLAAWPAVLTFYLIMCWGLPMLGMLNNKWTNEAEGAIRKRRYWMGVRATSAMFHIGTFGAFALMYFLHPYMFPVA